MTNIRLITSKLSVLVLHMILLKYLNFKSILLATYFFLAQVALRRQQGAGSSEVRDGEAATLAARKRAYRARLRCMQMSRNYPVPTPIYGMSNGFLY